MNSTFKIIPRFILICIAIQFLFDVGECSILDIGLAGRPDSFDQFKENSFSSQSFSTGIQDSTLLQALDFLNKGNFNNGIALARQVLERDSNSSAAYEILGAGYAKKGDLEQAISLLKKALTINPKQCSAITKTGDIYFAKKEYKTAKQTYLEAIQCSPDDHLAYQRLGILYEMEKDTINAITHYEKGLYGTDPRYTGIKVNLANLYNSTGNYLKATHLLEGLITDDKKDLYGHLILGESYLGVKKINDALHQFTIATTYYPNDPRAVFSLGISLKIAGDFDDAEKNLLAAQKLAPQLPAPYLYLAEVYMLKNDYDRALKCYSKLKELNQTNAADKGIAAINIKQKKYPEAITIYEKMIQTSQTDPEVYDLLISALQATGQLEAGEKRVKEMCLHFPKNPFSYYRSGLFYSYSTRYKEAMVQFQKALSLSPDDCTILKAMSLTSMRLGNRKESIDYAKQIIRIKPHDTENLFYLGGLLQDAKDPAAMELYRKVLALQGDHAFALNNLALLTLESGSSRDALQYAQKAASLADKNGNILDTYGWILFKCDQKDSSVSVLQKAIALQPQNPTIGYHLAVVYSESGKKAEAIGLLEKAISLNSNFKDLEEAKRLLVKFKK